MELANIVFSYCIYGEEQKYVKGLLYNVDYLLRKGFAVHISFSNISESLYNELLGYKVLLSEFEFRGGAEGMLHRVFDILDFDFEYFFIRDADSIVCDYEIELCLKFISSGRDLHIIRNHPLHNMPIMGGIFGGNKRVATFLKSEVFQLLFRSSINRARYQTDQKLLIFLYASSLERVVHASHIHFFWEDVELIYFDPLNYIGKDISGIKNIKLSLGKIEPVRYLKVIIKVCKWVLINRVLSLLGTLRN